MSSNAVDVLARTRETLRTAELAAADLEHVEAMRRVPAMRNVIVWGRAVTNVLQGLRGKVDGFDDWYEPWRAEMASDPLLRFLYRQRSEILKTGTDPSLSNITHVASFSTEDLPQAPQNARSFFIGDQHGGTGWEVELPDGSTERVYVSLPESQARSWVEFAELPETHLGAAIENRTLRGVCELYLAYLRRLVDAAERAFLAG
jgi:hypothetical protein